MVQVVENWALVLGIVHGREAAELGRDLVTVVLEVRAVEDVEGFPNLLRDAVGTDLCVLMPRTVARDAGLENGALASCRVRKAAPTLHFADPESVERVGEPGAAP
jgi:hypothetical protein